MGPYLLLVADHATARLIRVLAPRGVPEELARLDNAAGHGHERDLGSSPPGRGMSGQGSHTAYQPAHTMREHATEVFAQHIAAAVARATTAEPAARLVIVAGPEMLGVLRQHLPARTQAALEYPHNLANLPEADLHRRLLDAVAQLQQR